jgi:hypothetical protein
MNTIDRTTDRSTRVKQALEYARQRRDNAYLLYSIHANPDKENYTLANEQYFMGKYHEAVDHYWFLIKLIDTVKVK